MSWEDREGERWIRFDGELDYGPCEECRAEFQAASRAGPGPVVVDLAGVRFIASPGIQMLLNAQQDLSASGRTLVLTGLQPPIRHVFQRIGILAAIAER